MSSFLASATTTQFDRYSMQARSGLGVDPSQEPGPVSNRQ